MGAVAGACAATHKRTTEAAADDTHAAYPLFFAWPQVHAWPDAGTGKCMKMQAHATFIQTSNQQSITALQAQMNAQNC